MATIGNTIGSLIAYAIGAWGGRPFLERYGKYLLIRPHEIELGRAVLREMGQPRRRSSAACCRSSGRSSASRPAWPGCRCGQFIVYSDGRRLPVVDRPGLRRHGQLGANWVDIRHALQPFDLLIAVLVVIGFLLFVWLRLGRPGMPGRTGTPPTG